RRARGAASPHPPRRKENAVSLRRKNASLVLVALLAGAVADPAAAATVDANLDPSFRGTGKLTFPIDAAGVAGIAIDVEGRLVLPYTKKYPDPDLALLRIPDAGFVIECGFIAGDLGGDNDDYVYDVTAMNHVNVQFDGQLLYPLGSAG